MRAIVFAGPSLPANAAPTVPGVEWRPPARQGDVYQAAREDPEIIAIVDGYFEVIPTVWHKEILWAMAQGVHVYGAASVGALRAAELDVFGMKGVGRIYEMYRDGVLQDDDEVALLHGPNELGYPNLTDAMVNIRATLERAVEMAIIESAYCRELIGNVKSLFFKERSYARVLEAARSHAIDPAVLKRLADFIGSERVDQTRLDALAMLNLVSELLSKEVPRLKVSYKFSHTAAWEMTVRSADFR